MARAFDTVNSSINIDQTKSNHLQLPREPDKAQRSASSDRQRSANATRPDELSIGAQLGDRWVDTHPAVIIICNFCLVYTAAKHHEAGDPLTPLTLVNRECQFKSASGFPGLLKAAPPIGSGGADEGDRIFDEHGNLSFELVAPEERASSTNKSLRSRGDTLMPLRSAL
jgi:hypothetical protein